MTKDELLAGFLDRSLNEDQMLDFQALRSSDPVFSGQVQQMLKLENVLATSTPVVVPPADFLVSVESTVAAKVASGASGSFFTSLLSSTWTWVTAGAVATIGAGTLIVSSVSTNKAPEPTVATPTEMVAQGQQTPESTTPTITSPSATTREALPIVSANPVDRMPSAPLLNPAQNQPIMVDQSLPRLGTPANADATVSSEERILQKVIDDLAVCEERGDHMGCAQLAIEIGKKFRAQGNVAEAQTYLNKALRHAQQSRIVSHEIDAYGQLGITALQAGQTSAARQYFTSAVELGEKARVDVSRWQSQLESTK